MPIEILVPRLGWSMEEGTFGEWLKRDGDWIQKGDMLFVLEGEKAAQEIESFDSGTLHIPPDTPRPGDVVAVGQRLGYLLAEGEPPPAATPATATSPAPASTPQTRGGAAAAGGKPRVAGPAARRLARQLGIELSAVPTPDPTGRVRGEDFPAALNQARAGAGTRSNRSRIAASPRARRKARELGIGLSNLTGTGRNGRIRERDILLAARQPAPLVTDQSLRSTLPGVPGTLQAPTRIRRAIAHRMLASARRSAPVTLTTTVNASNLASLRQDYKDRGADPLPTYDDILVKLVSSLLRECPELNACWINDAIYLYDDINIAVAVDTPAGLLAPVLHHADRLSLEEIAVASRKLADLVRAGKHADRDLSTGTFTITNLGMFGIDHFTPIINSPQSAILGVGRITDAPVVVAGQVVVGKTLSLSLTFDHCVIDGSPAARWLQRLTRQIQWVDQQMLQAGSGEH